MQFKKRLLNIITVKKLLQVGLISSYLFKFVYTYGNLIDRSPNKIRDMSVSTKRPITNYQECLDDYNKDFEQTKDNGVYLGAAFGVFAACLTMISLSNPFSASAVIATMAFSGLTGGSIGYEATQLTHNKSHCDQFKKPQEVKRELESQMDIDVKEPEMEINVDIIQMDHQDNNEGKSLLMINNGNIRDRRSIEYVNKGKSLLSITNIDNVSNSERNKSRNNLIFNGVVIICNLCIIPICIFALNKFIPFCKNKYKEYKERNNFQILSSTDNAQEQVV